MRKRTVFMGGEVEDVMADALIGQLLMLDSQDPGKDIKIYINSPGGSVMAGYGIYDAMQLCRSDISTVCFGLAASMGAFLLGAGQKGKRYSMPNSRIMIHQPLGGAGGAAVDMEISAKEIMFHKANLNRIQSQYTGQPLSKIEVDTDRDNYMNPIQAREYGIIDHIIGSDDDVFQVKGSLRKFPKLKEEYVHDLDDLVGRSVMDGDSFLGGNPSWRFKSSEMEPYTPSQSRGDRWFRVKRISKEQYKEALERNRETVPDTRGPAKEKIDGAW